MLWIRHYYYNIKTLIIVDKTSILLYDDVFNPQEHHGV